MITDYIFEENYVQKDLENEKNRLRNDGKQAMMGMRAQSPSY